MKITLHGAAGKVTGSAYLVETERARLLVDFGMFQGGAWAEEKNCLPPGLEPLAVLIEHRHGFKPILPAQGDVLEV